MASTHLVELKEKGQIAFQVSNAVASSTFEAGSEEGRAFMAECRSDVVGGNYFDFVSRMLLHTEAVFANSPDKSKRNGLVHCLGLW